MINQTIIKYMNFIGDLRDAKFGCRLTSRDLVTFEIECDRGMWKYKKVNSEEEKWDVKIMPSELVKTLEEEKIVMRKFRATLLHYILKEALYFNTKYEDVEKLVGKDLLKLAKNNLKPNHNKKPKPQITLIYGGKHNEKDKIN